MVVLSLSFSVFGAETTSDIRGSMCFLFFLAFCEGVAGLAWISELVANGGSSLGASGCACVSDITTGLDSEARYKPIGLVVYQRPNKLRLERKFGP